MSDFAQNLESGFRQYIHVGEPSFPAMLLAAKLESFVHNF